MTRSRPVAQMKALLLLFPIIVLWFYEAHVADFLFDFQKGVSKMTAFGPRMEPIPR